MEKFFRGRKPFLVVRDPELLQTILVKDFGNFCNRGMFHLINHCAENLAEGLVQAAKSGNSVKIKELFGAYTIDVIAVTAFGLNINSFRDPDNLFLKNMRKIFEFKHRPIFTFVTMWPTVAKIVTSIGSGLWAKEPIQFFTKTVLSTMEERKSLDAQTQRVDFLQLMMNAEIDEENTGLSKGPTKKKLTAEEIVAQAFLFFIAGYETTASALQYLAYNLTMNPECAEKVYQEIADVIGDNEPSYDSLSKLVYLEQCLNEALRLQSPIHSMSRIAGNDIKVGQYQIPRGTLILLPYYGIHQDPETYPNPQQFDPERFSPSAKSSRHPMTFCPFGQGPRICIGMRLALMEAKIAMVHLMRKVRLVRCPETPVITKKDLPQWCLPKL